MPPYCRGSKHQKNGLAPLEERKRLCDPPNLPNLISVICLFPINMQPLALFLRKEPGGLSSISENPAFRQGFLIEMRFRPLSEGRFLPSSVASANRFNPRRLGGGLLGYRKNIAMALKVIQARRADMGIVKNQVKMIFPATSHFTSRNRLDAPTPKIPEVTTCVVLTGQPVTVALRMTEAEVRSAETPLAGSILKILELIGLMIFQPPKEVPSPIAAAAET